MKAAAVSWTIPLALLARSAVAQTPATSPVMPVRFGVDSFLGASDAPGFRHLTDQFWAGQSTFTPSVAYLRWEGASGRAARLSLGVGQASTAADPLFRQPVEVWWQQPAVGGNLTVGRFFAVFGAQEWQYEAKDGVGWTRTWGNVALSAALQRDRFAGGGNFYLRAGTKVGKEGAVGASFAHGRGFSYGSDFDSGYGVDGSLPLSAWTLHLEANRFSDPQGARFRFGMGSVSFTGWQNVEPFVSRYDWRDTSSSQALGSFRSTVVGARWQAASWLGIEAAGAHANGRNVAWLQFHLTWER